MHSRNVASSTKPRQHIVSDVKRIVSDLTMWLVQAVWILRARIFDFSVEAGIPSFATPPNRPEMRP